MKLLLSWFSTIFVLFCGIQSKWTFLKSFTIKLFFITNHCAFKFLFIRRYDNFTIGATKIKWFCLWRSRCQTGNCDISTFVRSFARVRADTTSFYKTPCSFPLTILVSNLHLFPSKWPQSVRVLHNLCRSLTKKFNKNLKLRDFISAGKLLWRIDSIYSKSKTN